MIDPREQTGAQRFFSQLLSGFGKVAENLPNTILAQKQAERQRKRQAFADLVAAENLRQSRIAFQQRQQALAEAKSQNLADKNAVINELLSSTGTSLIPTGGQAQVSPNPVARKRLGKRSLGSLQSQLAAEQAIPVARQKAAAARRKAKLEEQFIRSKIAKNNKSNLNGNGGQFGNGVTASQKRWIDLVTAELKRQQNDALDKIQTYLESKNVTFDDADKVKLRSGETVVTKKALKREALKFADPNGDRPGIGSFEQPVDSTALNMFKNVFDKITRQSVSKNLKSKFPSLSSGQQSQGAAKPAKMNAATRDAAAFLKGLPPNKGVTAKELLRIDPTVDIELLKKQGFKNIIG